MLQGYQNLTEKDVISRDLNKGRGGRDKMAVEIETSDQDLRANHGLFGKANLDGQISLLEIRQVLACSLAEHWFRSSDTWRAQRMGGEECLKAQ